MASTGVISRGRGRGRGFGVGWLGKFKPKKITSPTRDSGDVLNFADADESDDISRFFATEIPAFNTQTSVEEISSKIASHIFVETEEKHRRESQEVYDEKPPVLKENKDKQMKKKNIQFEERPKHEDIEDSKKKSILAEGKNIQINRDISSKNNKNNETENDDVFQQQFDPILLKAVTANEFVPQDYVPPRRKISRTLSHEDTNDEVALYMLEEITEELMEDPGKFDNLKDNLSEHLVNFISEEKTLQKVVDLIIDKAINEANFRYTAAKLAQHFDQELKFDNEMSFRKLFFTRCQEEFMKTKDLLKNPLAMQEADNISFVKNTALMFGELLCNMKLKEKVNIVYKNAIFMLVDLFLASESEELIVCLTRLLKLVGPELDKDRPKDVEAMFDKVKDFYLDSKKTRYLTSSVKTIIWTVYKLHSRDWDRGSVPSSPSFATNRKFSLPDEFAVPQEPTMYIPNQKAGRKFSSSTDRDSPIDWDDYYTGDDTIFDPKDIGDDEEFDAYEEFLRMSGQV